MRHLPWSKWFWADWRSDPGLRASSAHARGVWMDCLCIAAEADPVGYVLVNGKIPSLTDLSRLTGELEEAVTAALEELEKNGVFSRDRKGRIYNRRMVRDAKTSKINQKNGKGGGNPSLSKDGVKPTPVNPPVNPYDKRGVKPRSQKPEARDQKTAPDGAAVIARDAAWPAEVAVPMEWLGETYGKHPCVDGYEEAEKFVRYWTEGKGKGIKRTDWRATWRGWMARARPGPDTSWIDRYGYDKHLHGQRAKDAAA